MSTQLVAMDPACTPLYGGSLRRYAPNDNAPDGDANMTAQQRAAQTPKEDYAFVGGYYYFFGHAQSVCPSPHGTDQAEIALQQQTIGDVKSLLPTLEVIPQ